MSSPAVPVYPKCTAEEAAALKAHVAAISKTGRIDWLAERKADSPDFFESTQSIKKQCMHSSLHTI